MFPFDLVTPLPPDMVISVQIGAAKAFYFIVVLAAATLALMIAFERLDGDDENDHRIPPRKRPTRRCGGRPDREPDERWKEDSPPPESSFRRRLETYGTNL